MSADYSALHSYRYDERPVAGEHIIALPDGRSVNILLENRGLEWRAISTLSFEGNTINIVQRDYLDVRASMADIASDQLRLVGHGILLEQLYPVRTKKLLNGRIIFTAGGGLWWSTADAARIAKLKQGK